MSKKKVIDNNNSNNKTNLNRNKKLNENYVNKEEWFENKYYPYK